MTRSPIPSRSPLLLFSPAVTNDAFASLVLFILMFCPLVRLTLLTVSSQGLLLFRLFGVLLSSSLPVPPGTDSKVRNWNSTITRSEWRSDSFGSQKVMNFSRWVHQNQPNDLNSQCQKTQFQMHFATIPSLWMIESNTLGNSGSLAPCTLIHTNR